MSVINSADNIMFGSSEVNRVYKDSVIVWERGNYTPILEVIIDGTQQISLYDSFGGYCIQNSTDDYKIELDLNITGTGESEQIICYITGDYHTNAELNSAKKATIICAGAPTTDPNTYTLNSYSTINVEFKPNQTTLNSDYTNISANSGYVKARANSELYLFGYNSRQYLTGKCKGVKVYVNNILKCNLIPVKRNTDNSIGLYDTINDIFYETTAGT